MRSLEKWINALSIYPSIPFCCSRCRELTQRFNSVEAMRVIGYCAAINEPDN